MRNRYLAIIPGVNAAKRIYVAVIQLGEGDHYSAIIGTTYHNEIQMIRLLSNEATAKKYISELRGNIYAA